PEYPQYAAASADGTTYGGWTSLRPAGIRRLRLDGTKATAAYEHEDVGPQIPNADGSVLFTSDGVYGADLKPLDPDKQRIRTFPSLHPAYYVSVSRTGDRRQNAQTSVSIHRLDDRSVVASVEKLPGVGEENPFRERLEVIPLYDRIIADI